jgi:hypothetical protein
MVACHEHCLSMWDTHPREHLMRGAIRGPQAGVRGAIRGHQRPSEVLTLIQQRTLARLIRGNQSSSEAIRGHQSSLAHVGEARRASRSIRVRVLGAPLSVEVTRHLMKEAIRRHQSDEGGN